jgi:hypothetical protein
MRVAAAGTHAHFTFDTTGHSLSNPGWTSGELRFTARSARTRLMFKSLVGSCAGAILDYVRLSASRYPIIHIVKRGEWLWQIARQFLHAYYGTTPTAQLVAIETRTIYRLNRSKFPEGSTVLYSGTRLLIARTAADIANLGAARP